MQPQVICLGAVNVDLKYRVDDLAGFLREWGCGLKRGGEAAITALQEDRLQSLFPRFGHFVGRYGGGQAANTARALANMGQPVALTGRVGDDADGEFLKQSLSGVDLEHLATAGKSGRAYILVDAEGERTIIVAPNTNDELTELDIPWEALAATQFLHLTSFVGDGPLAVQAAVVLSLPDPVRLTLDPGELYARRGRAILAELLSRTETLLVTESEWRMLGGEMDPLEEWAPPIVLVKRGAKGARLLTGEKGQDFPPEAPVAVQDTLGAGDVFAAGYLAGRLHALSLAAAVRLANRAAAQSLQGSGRESYPDREWLDRQLEEL